LVENGISAFMNIGFTHHYAIISKVKDVEQKKFYIQIAAERLSTPLGILLYQSLFYIVYSCTVYGYIR